jgi:hypothetical protein
MAILEYLSREFVFSASADGTTYTEIGGINKWGWKEEPNSVETTDFDDAGGHSEMNTRIKYGLTLDGNYLMDAATGARDPGQKIVEKQARLLGPLGYVYIKVETRADDGEATPVALGSITARYSVKVTGNGGGNDDKLPWGAELTAKGIPTFAGIFDPDAV